MQLPVESPNIRSNPIAIPFHSILRLNEAVVLELEQSVMNRVRKLSHHLPFYTRIGVCRYYRLKVVVNNIIMESDR